MKYKYITNVTTLAELKQKYKKLAMQMHPDRGGDEEEMKVLNNEYDELFKKLKNTHKNKEGEFYTKETEETAEEWKEILEKLFSLNMVNVDIEVVGSFLWVTGETKPYKDDLKALGLKWARKKESWYLYPKGYKKYGKKNFKLEEKREKYSSQKVKNKSKTKKQKRIA